MFQTETLPPPRLFPLSVVAFMLAWHRTPGPAPRDSPINSALLFACLDLCSNL